MLDEVLHHFNVSVARRVHKRRVLLPLLSVSLIQTDYS